jgi:hypothetical protein
MIKVNDWDDHARCALNDLCITRWSRSLSLPVLYLSAHIGGRYALYAWACKTPSLTCVSTARPADCNKLCSAAQVRAKRSAQSSFLFWRNHHMPMRTFAPDACRWRYASLNSHLIGRPTFLLFAAVVIVGLCFAKFAAHAQTADGQTPITLPVIVIHSPVRRLESGDQR